MCCVVTASNSQQAPVAQSSDKNEYIGCTHNDAVFTQNAQIYALILTDGFRYFCIVVMLLCPSTAPTSLTFPVRSRRSVVKHRGWARKDGIDRSPARSVSPLMGQQTVARSVDQSAMSARTRIPPSLMSTEPRLWRDGPTALGLMEPLECPRIRLAGTPCGRECDSAHCSSTINLSNPLLTHSVSSAVRRIASISLSCARADVTSLQQISGL